MAKQLTAISKSPNLIFPNQGLLRVKGLHFPPGLRETAEIQLVPLVPTTPKDR